MTAIAAERYTGASIKRYKEKGKYSEWEFVYDPAAAQQQQQQQQQRQAGQNGTNTPGQNGQPAGPPNLFPQTNPVPPAGNPIPRQ